LHTFEARNSTDILHEIDGLSNTKKRREVSLPTPQYFLFSHGMDAFISLVAKRPDSRSVYSIGRRAQYIPFPVEKLYDRFNLAENLDRSKGWNGSTIVGGSSGLLGSGLKWEELRDITLSCLRDEGIIK
jgi:hypothetical protein